MTKAHVTRTVLYHIVCCDCGATLAGPYTSYDAARVQVPNYQKCDHPTQKEPGDRGV